MTPIERSIFRAEIVAALVRVLQAAGKHKEAEDVHRQTLEARRLASPADPLDIAEALDDLGALLLTHGKIEEAELYLREGLEIRGSVPWTEENAWRRWNTQSLLGAALEAQQEFTEADPLLIDAAARLTESEYAPRRIIRAASDRASSALERMAPEATLRLPSSTARCSPVKKRPREAQSSWTPLATGAKREVDYRARRSDPPFSVNRARLLLSESDSLGILPLIQKMTRHPLPN